MRIAFVLASISLACCSFTGSVANGNSGTPRLAPGGYYAPSKGIFEPLTPHGPLIKDNLLAK